VKTCSAIKIESEMAINRIIAKIEREKGSLEPEN
jgi:hypothetical protein